MEWRPYSTSSETLCGPLYLQLPQLLTDQQLGKIKDTNTREEIAAAVRRERLLRDPDMQGIIALKDYCTSSIQALGGNVVRLASRDEGRQLDAWRQIERMCEMVMLERAKKTPITNAELNSLLERWLLLRLASAMQVNQAHELDGHKVVGGIIQPKGRK